MLEKWKIAMRDVQWSAGIFVSPNTLSFSSSSSSSHYSPYPSSPTHTFSKNIVEHSHTKHKLFLLSFFPTHSLRPQTIISKFQLSSVAGNAAYTFHLRR